MMCHTVDCWFLSLAQRAAVAVSFFSFCFLLKAERVWKLFVYPFIESISCNGCVSIDIGVVRKQAVAKGTQNDHYAYKSMLYELDVEDVNPLKCSFILSHFLFGKFSSLNLRASKFNSFHCFSLSSPCKRGTRHTVKDPIG